MKKIFLYLFLFTLVTAAASAQTQRIVADQIIAKVGDKIILKSDIENAISDYKRQAQNVQLPPNPECAFLEGQLVQKVLVLQANKDSIIIGDDEIDALLDNQIRYFISQYGSKDVLEQIAGKTVYQLKEDLRQPFIERQLADKMRAKILENVKITPSEVQAFYDKIPKDSLPFYESELEVAQIVIYPKANKDIEDYITNQLNDLKKQVESGQKKFTDLAKVYSQDPSAKENGGQFSINRTDKGIDPTFLSAAFKLKEGQISPVIKSKFGLHIIQMVSRAGDDAVVRHILIIPAVTETEINAAKQKLDSVRSKIVAGTLNFNEAVNKYSEDDATRYNAGRISSPYDGSTRLTIDQLDKGIVANLKSMKAGDISQPLVYTDDRGKQAVRLVYLAHQTQPHRMNLKDDYDRVSQQALGEKKQKALDGWFKQHISDFYIDIDPEYHTCKSLDFWFASETTASN
ncbi:peptidylprolyl isomerase [Parafilimonas terrae]|uniref:Periplasmic chaperone for outer membrane proteins SurA n=1 Tax=Parafilimonas terrae TaxID=1465490 RepID=A0A1I5X0C1_9BACT|nr:peptidylprolyl isomerase [Parafilimonas terrae]SFQ25409.1 periplasmic chaperone for outer membrane proteins SurA [Parafilimonas terrae]